MQNDLERFSSVYHQIHSYIAILLCVFGVLGNSLNIFILTRKKMISTMNILLTALAVFDGLKSAVHLPYIIVIYYIHAVSHSPTGKARYIMFYAIVAMVFHTASIWLTVSLAIFRYIAVKFPLRGVTLCSKYRAKLTIFIVCVAAVGVCLPNSLSYSYVRLDSVDISNKTSWDVTILSETGSYTFVQRLNMWFLILIVRLLPCLLLLVLSILLIQELRGAAKSRSKLTGQCNSESDDIIERRTETNRTTGMLVVVVVLFIVIELPHGILILLLAISNYFWNFDIYKSIYESLGDLIDDITLLNNGINFVIYCTMSKKFRDTFMQMFSCSNAKSKYTPTGIRNI
ncbi:G-protein coupled receptor [Biomphalaria glabrata]|nr:G-protein coupled receptor [Biomphalaria glabrata]